MSIFFNDEEMKELNEMSREEMETMSEEEAERIMLENYSIEDMEYIKGEMTCWEYLKSVVDEGTVLI
jgi:hypothetical protein